MSKPTDNNAFIPGWGARLTQARKSLKKNQAEIGELLGVRNTAVSKWESEAVEIDLRSLKALEFLLGIHPEWVRQGIGPMVVNTWNQAMRDSLTGVAGGRIDGVWTAPASTGMMPLIKPGDVVLWAAVNALVAGAIYLVEGKGAHRDMASVAPKTAKIGQAFPVDNEGGEEWLIYRLEDRRRPGTFPPLALRDMEVIGQAVAFARRFPDPEEALT